jgi:hypothetical protein
VLRLTVPSLITTATVIALAAVGLLIARPVLRHPIVYPALVIAAIAALVTLPRYKRPELALSVVLIVLSAFPAQWESWMLRLGDQGQFAGLRYVLEHSPSNGVVLDGWSGYGVFRPHANYYWMLHPGVRAMLSPEVKNALVEGVLSARVAPDIIVLDANIQALSPRLAQYVEQTYRAGPDQIYVRRSQ